MSAATRWAKRNSSGTRELKAELGEEALDDPAAIALLEAQARHALAQMEFEQACLLPI